MEHWDNHERRRSASCFAAANCLGVKSTSAVWRSGRCCPLTAAEVERSLKFILTMVADSKNRHGIRIDIEMKNNSVRWAGTDAE